MAIEPNMPRNKRNTLIAGVMLVVLILAVGAAGLLVLGKGGARRRGADLLGGLLAQGLPALWGEQDLDQWFLITDGTGRAIGWSRTLRRRADGGYVGGRQMKLTNGAQYRETWTLNDEATAGKYTYVAYAPHHDVGQMRTVIALADGKVSVSTSAWPRTVVAPAPPQYVPEGMMDLVIRQAGRQDRDISCYTIYSELAVRSGRAEFSTVAIAPQADGSVLLSSLQRLYTFDEQGEVQRIDDLGDGETWQRISWEKLAERFPEVRLMGPADEPPAEEMDETAPEESAPESAPTPRAPVI